MTDQSPPPATPSGPGEPSRPDPASPGDGSGASPVPGTPPVPGAGLPGASPAPGTPPVPGAGLPHAGPPPQGWDPAQAWGQPSGPPPGWDPAQGAWAQPAGPPPQGWAFPPTGGYPPGAGPYGGQPWYPGAPTGWYPPGYGLDPNDALVTPPGGGIGAWFDRFWGALRRGWRQLVPIMLLTQVLPAAVLSVISFGVDPSAGWEAQAETDSTGLPDNFATGLLTVVVVLVVGSLVIGLVQALGWAAGSWVITRQAAGQPAELDAALRYGLRRAVGLWGWTLLVSLLVGIGVCFCVLPGIYLAFALSMAGPVYLFERDNPIGRSFRMFHDRLGLLLGRVALVGAAVIIGTVVSSILESVGTTAFGEDPFASPGAAVGVVVVIGIAAVLALPAHLAQLVGLLITYAEQRAHEGPVNGATLAAELG